MKKEKKIIINQYESVIFGVTIILNMKVTVLEIKQLSVEEYINKIRPYLKEINNLKKSYTWKIQLGVANILVSSIDHDEEHVMHSKSDIQKSWWMMKQMKL